MIVDVYMEEESYNDSLNDLVKKFVMFICKEYSILPRKISIEGYDLVGNNGMCFDEEEGKFTILVKNGRDLVHLFTTVAHEMIHVKQYMTQDLGTLLDENYDLPYEERWWEEEAFENAHKLVEKFSEKIKING